jgi:membrane-associated protein
MSGVLLLAVFRVEPHLDQRFAGPHIDYIGVGLAAALSWLLFAGPGEVALIAAGIAAARHRVDISGVVAVAWLGAMLGGTAGWLIGLKGGRALLTAPGPLHELRLGMVGHGDRLYARYGYPAVYFAPSWMAGINGMRASRFVPANTIAALVWALLVGLGAYILGPSVREFLDDIGTVGLVALALAVTLAAVQRWRVRARR